MKPKPKKLSAKKSNPQDATLRNIRALKKRVKDLETYMKGCQAHILDIDIRIRQIQEKCCGF